MNIKFFWAALILSAQVSFGFGASAQERFYVTGAAGQQTVLDRATGIMWAKEYETSKTWKDAMAYCEALDYGGYTDWRLPNVTELGSLVDVGQSNPASTFPDMPDYYFWSSSSDVGSTGSAWFVGFFDGYVYSSNKASYYYYARCARSGP